MKIEKKKILWKRTCLKIRKLLQKVISPHCVTRSPHDVAFIRGLSGLGCTKQRSLEAERKEQRRKKLDTPFKKRPTIRRKREILFSPIYMVLTSKWLAVVSVVAVAWESSIWPLLLLFCWLALLANLKLGPGPRLAETPAGPAEGGAGGGPCGRGTPLDPAPLLVVFLAAVGARSAGRLGVWVNMCFSIDGSTWLARIQLF